MSNIRNQLFVSYFKHIQKWAHGVAVDKGFWDVDRNDGELLALIHSEISEALEALRKNVAHDKHLPQYTGVEVELADAVIRIMDMAQRRGYNLADAIVDKIEFNKTREHKHGKKF